MHEASYLDLEGAEQRIQQLFEEPERRRSCLAWLCHDPDPSTQRATIDLLVQASEGDEEAARTLKESFVGRLAFGTAGLRGLVGPGPGRMNEALLRQVTWGLSTYLGEYLDLGDRRGATEAPAVVVGYDGRLDSRYFAEVAARVFAAARLRVYLWPTLCPTPLLAYSLTALRCVAGVMVTASDNPPAYNGFKVYWGDGAQITPPHDSGISAAIDRAPPSDQISCPSLAELESAGWVQETPASVGEGYLKAIDQARSVRGPSHGLRVVYSAMHGVGGPWVKGALGRAGYGEGLVMVPEQEAPDGRFPTVAFPNPEEPGALALSLALAETEGADIILANDPDADRLAVAVRDEAGIMRTLSGDQIGALIGDQLLYRNGAQRADALVACSIVSSTLLPRMAKEAGVQAAQTLTGFKWIARAGLQHEARGGQFLFGYEEAIGFSLGPIVRDKDGVSAALCLCDMAAEAKGAGESLWSRLEAIYARFGVTLSALESWTLAGLEGAAQIRALMAQLRATPPTALAETFIERVEDLAEAEDEMRGDVLIFHLAGGGRIIARPSGTEPKIKFYFETTCPREEGESENGPARRRAADQLQRWVQAWRQRYQP